MKSPVIPSITSLEDAKRALDNLRGWFKEVDSLGGLLSALSVGVISFKGRKGLVVPQAGDYTAAQVGADAAGTTAAHAALTAAHGATGAVVGTTNSQTISNKKFGSDVNYSEFEADGTLHAVGDATTWQDINISLNSLATSGATVMDVVTIGSNKFRAFIGTGTQAQQADGSLELLHNYLEGSDINPHVHWMPENTNAGNVKLSLGYRWWNRGAAMPAETVISVTQAAPGVQYQEQRAVFPTISGAGMGIGSRFVFRIFRDPGDAANTYTHYAIALDFGLHYQCDTLGSRGVTAK